MTGSDNSSTPNGAQAAERPGRSTVPPQLALLGDFELRHEIGRGGMGTVYEAWQRSLQRRVALKVLSSQISSNPTAVQRFQREARAAAKLQHVHITSVIALGEQDGIYYYAMEFVPGCSLYDIISQARESRSDRAASLDPDETVVLDRSGTKPAETTAPAPERSPATGELAVSDSTVSLGKSSGVPVSAEEIPGIVRHMVTVADALQYAHREGVVHRDIKPHNLMLSDDGRMKITDFGLARLAEQPGVTVTGELLGSPLYMSPEQILGDPSQQDHRTDIYSLGATMYEWLTLQPPYPGETRERVISLIANSEPRPPRALNHEIPVDLETVCLRAIDRDRDRRYQTAGEFGDDLRRFLMNRPIKAKRAGSLTRVGRFLARHQVASITVAAVIVAVVLGWALMSTHGEAAKSAAEAEQATADAEQAGEDADMAMKTALSLSFLTDVAPPEIGTLVSGAERAAPLLEGIMQTGEQLTTGAGTVRSGGPDPGAVGTPEGIARRATRDFYLAAAGTDEVGTDPAGANAISAAYAGLLDEAVSFWEADEPEEALTRVESFLAGYPENFRALQLRTALHGWIGQCPEMIDDANQLIALRSTNPEGYIWITLAHLLQGEFDLVPEDLDRAVDNGAPADWVCALHGLMLVRMHPTEAIAVLNDLPNLIIAMLTRAMAHAANGDYDSAVADISRVIELEAENADALAVRGNYYGALGEFAAAAADLKKAMNLAGQTPEIAVQWLWARAVQRKLESAQAADARPPEGAEDETGTETEADDVSSQRVRDWFSRFVWPRSPGAGDRDPASPPLGP